MSSSQLLLIEDAPSGVYIVQLYIQLEINGGVDPQPQSLMNSNFGIKRDSDDLNLVMIILLYGVSSIENM